MSSAARSNRKTWDVSSFSTRGVYGSLLARLEECLGKAHDIGVAHSYIALQVLLLQKVQPYVEVAALDPVFLGETNDVCAGWSGRV